VRWVEGSRAGQVVLTAFMAVIVTALLVWNAPNGPAVAPAKPLAAKIVNLAGIDQDWAVFAPDPRGVTVGVYAVVTRADGSRVLWHPPPKGVVLAPYRTYRWQKYVERLRGDDYSFLWEDAARAIAHQVGGSGPHEVRKVVLVRLFQYTVVPGSGGPRPPLQRFAFYTLTLP